MTMHFDSGVIKSAHQSVDIRWGLFSPKPGCHRYILFVNGRSEWIEKYHYLPEALALPDDCGMLTLDHRGQGASGGNRGTVEDYDYYVDDLTDVVRLVIGDSPYVALAHSMGGLILTRAVVEGRLKPRSMVLASPFFGLPRKPLPPWFANKLARFLYSAGLGKLRLGLSDSDTGSFEGNRLTHDRARFDRMKDSPYPIPSATVQWVAESVRAAQSIRQPVLLGQLTMPTLVMMGSNETIVDHLAASCWVQQAQSVSTARIDYHEIEGARHELFSEIDPYYQSAIAMTRQWFAEFLDKPPQTRC